MFTLLVGFIFGILLTKYYPKENKFLYKYLDQK